jgi:hypothetical protein
MTGDGCLSGCQRLGGAAAAAIRRLRSRMKCSHILISGVLTAWAVITDGLGPLGFLGMRRVGLRSVHLYCLGDGGGRGESWTISRGTAVIWDVADVFCGSGSVGWLVGHFPLPA